MNNQLGGFDLDAFGSQSQQGRYSSMNSNNGQQQGRYNSNGPSMNNYDPQAQVIGMPPAPGPYNINGTNVINGSGTHKTYMPSGGSTTVAASVSIRTSHQQPNGNNYGDLSFDQQPQAQRQV